MTFAFSLPKNEEFFGHYAGLTTTLRLLGYLAQALAAVVEFAIIFALVRAKVAPVFPAFAFAAGIGGGIIGVLLIEGGLRRFLPYAVRAILYRRFSGLHLVITCFVFVVTFALTAAHITLSFKGSKDLAAAVIQPPPPQDTAPIDSTAQATKAEAFNQWKADSIAVAARYAPQVEATRAKYAAQEAEARQALAALEVRERTEGKRYPTRKAELNTRLAGIRSAQAEALATLEGGKANALESAQAARNKTTDSAEGQRQEARNKVKEEDSAAQAEAAAQVAQYGSGLAWLTSVICLLVLLSAITIQEVANKGAEVEETAIPTQYDFSPSVWVEFTAMLSEKWNAYARRWIARQAKKTPAPPLPEQPHPLYDADALRPKRIKTQTEATPTAQPANVYQTLFEQNGHHNGHAPHNAARPVIIGFGRVQGEESNPSVSNATVSNAPPPQPSGIAPKACLHCGIMYPPKVVWQKFCSATCKEAHHAAQHGGQTFSPKEYRKATKRKAVL